MNVVNRMPANGCSRMMQHEVGLVRHSYKQAAVMDVENLMPARPCRNSRPDAGNKR
jgi:hypothetical protein